MAELKNQKQRDNIVKREIDSDDKVIVHEYPTLIDWAKTAATNITNNVFTIRVAVALSFIAFFFYFPSMGGDQDIWFHIRYGSHFVKNLTWKIDHNQFNWTLFPPQFTYVTWIGSSLLFITYSLFSHYGLYLLLYTVIGLIIFCFIYYLRDAGYRFDIMCLLSIIAALLVLSLKYLYIKPDMFSGLFFAVACLIYFKVKRIGNERLFYIYPPLFLLWVNTHGGFIVGLFLITAAFGTEILNFLFFKKAGLSARSLLYFGISVALSYAVLGINPEGYNYFISIVKDFFSPEMQTTKATIAEYGSMWNVLLFKPSGLRFKYAAFAMFFMLASFLSVSAYLVRKKKFFDLSAVFLVAFFYVFGMSLIRASQYFPLIWFFAFFYTYKRFEDVKLKGVFNFLSLGIIFLLTIQIIRFALVDYPSLAWFGVNWDESYPVNEVKYIKKTGYKGNLWNDYLDGGYLLWALYPDYKIFIDPRYGGFMRNYMPTAEEFSDPKGVGSYTKRFPFKMVLAGFHETQLINWLLKADWRVAYLDKNAVVMVDKSLIKDLSKDALAEDVSIGRYRNVSNPDILRTLFNFYVHLSPELGKELLELYKTNVSTLYGGRGSTIMEMQNTIAQKEAQIEASKKAKKTK